MLKVIALLAASVAGVQLMSANIEASRPPVGYTQQIQAWRVERVEHLKAPNGWLSLVGLHWLKDGSNTVGSAEGNDIVLTDGPVHLGVVVLKSGKATITLDAKADATIDGKKAKSAVLLDDSNDHPTTIAFGTRSFYLIDRSGKKGLRVKDSAAPTLTHFVGIDSFAIDPSWRVVAKWAPYHPAHELEIPTVLGTVDKLPVPGKAVFERDGKTYTLLPVLEDPSANELWFIFADRTSGKQTYGAARFLYAGMPKDGKVVIDFNKAYNPPCAFTPYATCPLAPSANRLDLAVTAGEKKYRGGRH